MFNASTLLINGAIVRIDSKPETIEFESRL